MLKVLSTMHALMAKDNVHANLISLETNVINVPLDTLVSLTAKV